MRQPRDDEVRAIVEQALGGVREMERRPSPFRSSFALEELVVRFSDGRAMNLILKDLSREGLDEHARLVKPRFLYDPLREIEVYRTVLPAHELGTAICYGAVAEPGRGRFLLLLEKVSGLELYQVGDLATWAEAARWLASLHEQVTGVRARRLLRFDGDFLRIWPGRARRFVGDPGLRRIASRYDEVIERLLALPQTFVHGEFYASNVLVSKQGTPLRVCAVDWEMAGIGPSLLDLAALTTGRWSANERTALARAYRSTLASPMTEANFLTALTCSRLHLAVQWLGWSSRWSPPPDHAHDWLGEALRAAEELDL